MSTAEDMGLRAPASPRIKVTRQDRTSVYIALDGKTIYTVQDLAYYERALADVERSIAPKETTGESAIQPKIERGLQAFVEKADGLLKTMREMQPPDVLLKQITWAGEARNLLEDTVKQIRAAAPAEAIAPPGEGTPPPRYVGGFCQDRERCVKRNAELAALKAAVPEARDTNRQQQIMEHDYPIYMAFHRKYAMPSMLPPSCLVCGQAQPEREDWAIQHAELPNIIVCTACRDGKNMNSERKS